MLNFSKERLSAYTLHGYFALYTDYLRGMVLEIETHVDFHEQPSQKGARYSVLAPSNFKCLCNKHALVLCFHLPVSNAFPKDNCIFHRASIAISKACLFSRCIVLLVAAIRGATALS